jgi:acyl transferase domain-containing protein/NAD(P)H-dependent flavin oxidoreductase YrpB (nitropropane dioxygenase family)/NAD(P)-dependent dehydrogenase (short-subunit alcohol dehydrogenase family)
MKPINGQEQTEAFSVVVSNAPGWLDSGLVAAGIRAGAAGILNSENASDPASVLGALRRIRKLARGPLGLKLQSESALAEEILSGLDLDLECIVFTSTGFTGSSMDTLAKLIGKARARCGRVLLEITAAAQAQDGVQLGVDGLIAKGHEAGGAVGDETAFILLQRLRSECSLPVWVHGGIGLHSAAACYAGGAAGIVLDNQLLLAAESSLPSRARVVIERMEGDETTCVGLDVGCLYRLCKRPGMSAVDQLQRIEQEVAMSSSPEKALDTWKDSIRARVGWNSLETNVWPLGQDAAFAASLARRFRTVSGIVKAMRDSISQHLSLAVGQEPLSPRAALAQFHGTDYPILQGPMTRVSDTAPFALAVAENGALPFLALALLRGPQVRKLLAETKELLGSKPWGVGILGFVPPDLRSEQMEVVREFRPPFAIIAGGRPDQALGLENEGTSTYLHVPSPALLRMFLHDGARGFIFEGRECGGHVGPRTSLVLWDTMIETILDEIRNGIPAAEVRVVFAGGIHDARSAAMVSAMAAPLVEQGVRIGVLLGTAYLFTEEAVRGGAIVKGFQQEAIACQGTVILESGPGHATRCVETPFYRVFREHKRRLIEEKKTTGEIRDALEDLNIGRLRVASKGITRAAEGGNGSARYVEVPAEEQHSEGMYMIGQVAAMRHSACTMRALHESVSPGSAEFLRQAAALLKPGETEQQPAAPANIAIVGMSCLLPKAPDVRTFWSNVINKVNAITEVPGERFNVDLYFDTDRQARDKIYSRWGGFLDDTPFDPIRYGIPPNALPSIDPMQLLSLVVVDRALGDAGYRDREFPRDKTSVIFGLSGGLGDLGINYAVRSALAQHLERPPEELLNLLPEWTEDSFAGILPNVTSGRVANRFDLGGVNFSVDAACASSLAAVYIAAQELTSGTSDMVIVGGVDTVQSPFGYLCFSKSQALSPRGTCRTFDETADGIAISEGITMLVLKRLEDAERDGDRIYAVVKGVAGSSDGRGRSMTAPRHEGQVSALRRAYTQAGIRPSTVGLIEAHGTGTAAGDAAELAALSVVFSEDQAAPRSCSIGSVKSMVGHTKSAAGVTGLMKAALALYHKTLPPTLNVEKPNAKLREPDSAFFINNEPQPWIVPTDSGGEEAPRRAGVSSFGFGGTNFHAVLEEYGGDLMDRSNLNQWPAELFLWSGASAEALASTLTTFAAALDSASGRTMTDLAAAVCARPRETRPGGIRLSVVATSIDDLKTKLESVLKAIRGGSQKIEDSQGVYMAPYTGRAKVAFLFPGQGSQKPGMLRDLALSFPEVRESVQRAERVLAGQLAKNLGSYIYPPPAFTPEDERQQMREITDTHVAQPALGAVEAALHRLLARCGVKPDMTAGHSYGEYAALYAAGVFSEETLTRLSEARGRAIVESVSEDPGTMAAVAAGMDTVLEALGDSPGVVIANQNSPRQTVISGPTEAVRQVLEKLASAKLAARLIPVACAFHSPLMQPARDRLGAVLSFETFHRPSAAVFSNTLADRYPEEPGQIVALLTDHLVKPVRFVDEILAMYEQGARVFVEVGPKGVLTGLAKQILAGKEVCLIQLDGERDGVVSFLHALAQLAIRGVDLEAEQLFRGRVTRLSAAESAAERVPGWLVNGGHVFPKDNRPKPVKPLKLAETASSPAAAPPIAAPPSAPSMPLPTLVAAGADAVMLQFQQLMNQFLQTQASVMTSFLGGAPANRAPLAAVIPLQHAVPAVATPAQVPLAITPPAAPLAAPSQPLKRDWIAELRSIASERTGYPSDMLDLDAGIEADLGIDSIKRVEILSAFQRRCTAQEQAQVQKIMDTLTGARTLRQIADRLSAVLSANPAAPAPVAISALVPQRDCISELRLIASERTGYPADMLDLDAGIEADLGIDSIKRVEILSAFQRRCNPQEQAHVQKIMDALTSARTLRQIADRLSAVLPAGSPAPAPAPISDLVPRRDCVSELRSIASERTGYPADMLDLDAGIEADLGIDSIKRVEILSVFQRGCSATEQIQVQAIMDTLTSARTLRQIADRLTAVLAGAGSGNIEVPRCILAAVPRQRRQGGPVFYPGRVCVITDDEGGIAESIAHELARGGEKPVLLRHGPDAAIASDGVFSTDLTDAAAVAAVVSAIQQQYGAIGAVIHLLPLRTNGPAIPDSLDQWRHLVDLDIKSLYALARAAQANLKHTLRAGGALFAAATARGGAFGLEPASTLPPTHYGVADFVKTLSLELEGVLCKVVDLDASDPVAILRQKLVDELCSTDDTLQVGLPGDRRLTVMPALASIEGEPARRIGGDWVFLLTGGARGITAEVAKLAAQRYRGTYILAGSSPLPSSQEPPDTAGVVDTAKLKAALITRLRVSASTVKPAEVESALHRLLKNREIHQTLQALRNAGAEVEYHAVDVRDESSFGALIEHIYQKHGRLDAVVHGAGIIEDKLIQDKTPESFDRVVDTKVDSAFLLSRKLRPESLQCLVFMSSISAMFGNRAQADYASANGVMNGLAAALAAQWPGRVVAMNWGPWDQAGMVSEETRQQFLSRGVQMIPPAAGVEALLREIESGQSGQAMVALGGGPWSEAALTAAVSRKTVLTVGSTG